MPKNEPGTTPVNPDIKGHMSHITLLKDDTAPTLPENIVGPVRFKLTNDYMFRAVLQKSNRTLKHLLSALLGIPYVDIRSCEITNPIILGESIDEKTSILDVRVLLNSSRLINLEMQIGNLDYWPNRALFYLSRLYCNIQKGQDYSDILPATHIGILNKSPSPDVAEFYSQYVIMNPKNQHIFSGNFTLSVLDLSQTENVPEEERSNELYYWARLFKAATWEEIRMLTEQSEVLKEAAGYLRELSEEETIRFQCEGRERYYMDMSSAKHAGIAEGRASGLKEGRAEGRASGLKEGRAEGRASGLKEGRAEGAALTIALMKCFQEEGREGDISRLSEPDFFQNALKEYHLDAALSES